MIMTETERLLALKAALLQTTHTVGWTYVREIADNMVKRAIQASLDEEESLKAEPKRLYAKALQSGFQELFSVIETTKTFNTQEEPDWLTDMYEQEEMAAANRN